MASEDSLVNALERIRTIAGLHYFGGAYDPEHMRVLANLAADALDGREIPPMPDREEMMRRGRELADLLGLELAEENEGVEGNHE